MALNTTSRIQKNKLLIVPFNLEDLDQVIKIENQVFTTPWSKQAYLEISRLSNVHFWVVKHLEEVAAYILYQETNAGHDLELHTIATSPGYQKLGLAKKMIKFMINYAHKHKLKHIFLLVRPSNLAALSLYNSFDFKTIGLRPNYYANNQEDAFLMKLDLSHKT